MSPGNKFIDEIIETFNEKHGAGLTKNVVDDMFSGKKRRRNFHIWMKDIRNECIDKGGPINTYKTISGDSVCGRCGFVIQLH